MNSVSGSQLWLDGIATRDGKVNQFVATPVGSGYSVEAQMTGKETVAGLQFEIVPTKRGVVHGISVKNLTSHLLNFIVEASTTVDDVKRMMQAREGIPANQQRFIYNGKQLEDGQ